MKKTITRLATLGTSTFFLASITSVVLANDSIGSITASRGYAENIGNVINSALTIVMVFAALLVLLYLVWGGIEWITSGGDKGKTESARNKITASIIGLIILAASYALFNFALYLLGFNGSGDLLNSIQRINTTQSTPAQPGQMDEFGQQRPPKQE